MPTIRDVAKRAGEASKAVSRVINDSRYMSDETRTNTQAALTELGCIPNMPGPSSQFYQTKILALLRTVFFQALTFQMPF